MDASELRRLKWMLQVRRMDKSSNETLRGTTKVVEVSKKVHKEGEQLSG